MNGLNKCDRPRYNKFIQGRDGSPLIELLKIISGLTEYADYEI